MNEAYGFKYDCVGIDMENGDDRSENVGITQTNFNYSLVLNNIKEIDIYRGENKEQIFKADGIKFEISNDGKKLKLHLNQ